MEPTTKEIAEWLREAGRNEQKTFEFFGYDKSNALKKAQLWETRAAQVEAIGEMRCGSCDYNTGSYLCSMGVDACSHDFGCCHWKRKEG